METLWQDLRYAARGLRAQPGFTAVAVIALALGIGANSTIFSIVNAVLLQPLPYPNSERLVKVSEVHPQFGQGYFYVPDFIEVHKQNQHLEKLAAYKAEDFHLTGKGEAEQLRGEFISPNFLPLLGVAPRPGRAFLDEEYQPGQDRAVLISHRLWQRRFNSDPNLIGQALTLDEKNYTVVGVMPPQFQFSPMVDLWLPLTFNGAALEDRGYFALTVIGRLKPGVTLEQAQKELSAITQALGPPRRRMKEGLSVRLDWLRDLLVKDVRQKLFLLWGAVGFVLLISCANVASLMLARAASRQKEIAIRTALGAGRFRLIRQLLTESVLLAAVGGAVGLLLAMWGMDLLIAASPDNLPRINEVGINGWGIAFTFLLSLLTGVVFGLAPALQFSKPDLNSALKDGAAISVVGFRLWRHHRLRSLLTVAEIALALVLLIGAGLLIKSFWRLQQVNPGFEPEKLIAMQLVFPGYKYRDPHQVIDFTERLVARLETVPGAKFVGAATSLPFTKSGGMMSITIEGRSQADPPPADNAHAGGLAAPPPLLGGDNMPSAVFSHVSPDYFRAMGIPLRQGREFTEHDNENAPGVAIISETMARRYWPGADAIGQRIGLGNPHMPWVTVVGIVGNVRHFTLEAEARPEMYFSFLQPLEREKVDANTLAQFRLASYVNLVLRTSIKPGDLAAAVRNEVSQLDPDQPIARLTTMEAMLAEVVAPRRFNMLLFGMFAGVALILAAVGIYGVMAYSAAQRTHEIGIRLALGAQTGDVLKLVIGQGLMLTSLGVAIGLAAAFVLTRLLTALLFSVTATDPLTFAVIALLLASVSLVACYLPARRATKVDPMIALRYE